MIVAGMIPVAIMAAPETIIQADASKPRIPTSPILYGLFYEEINRAGDGGLYAELVRNRSFEDTIIPERSSFGNGQVKSPTGWSQSFPDPETPEAWSLVRPEASIVSMALDKDELANPSRLRSLRIEIQNAGGGEVGVENAGFWGIPIEKDKVYRLALSAKATPGFRGELRAQLVAEDGHILAQEDVGEPTSNWKRRAVLLRSSGTDFKARLRIITKAHGSVWLDTVSLFPQETFLNRKEGLRPDLVHRMSALKPRFMRFPGGCIVEGFSKETLWHWKNTVGDITTRKGHYLLWSYRTTGGLGFHEFLQLCEDLGMKSLFVINCGMTCQGRNGELLDGAPLQELIQEALDGIEYAIGPSTSKWGALRAAHGHPEPFKLGYLEIGNENYGPEYETRYALFAEAIRARYPDIQLIANTWLKNTSVQWVDEHFYPDPEFFIAHHDHYDSQDRRGPKIYVGEYAAVQGAGGGNLRAAIGEAAFLTGIERNQDVVQMSSYAPLFANVKAKAWQPDAIYFDNHRSYVTPSYYVQQIFAENRGDEVIPFEIRTPMRPYFRPGGAGMESCSGPVKLSGLSVESGGQILFQFDPARSLDQFQINSGGWLLRDGVLDFAPESGSTLRLPNTAAADSLLSSKLRFLTDKSSMRLRVRDNGRPNENRDYCTLSLGDAGRMSLKFEHTVGWSGETLGACDLGPIDPLHWYEISVKTQGPLLECRVDGRLVLSVRMRDLPAITSVITRVKSSGTVIIKAVNTLPTPQEVAFDLCGFPELASDGDQVLLCSTNPDDENSLEEPLNVAPKSSRVTGVGNKFVRTLVPNSVTVLRLKVK